MVILPNSEPTEAEDIDPKAKQGKRVKGARMLVTNMNFITGEMNFAPYDPNMKPKIWPREPWMGEHDYATVCNLRDDYVIIRSFHNDL
ncbi:hypothetical protein GPALN_004829 [Globodera pallida]|nr:hypothetical protein GPALN_004829 [Globodera pallida]